VKGSHVKSGFLSELHITDTVKSDSGTFTCIAKNPYGRAERIVHLQVQGMSFKVFRLKIKNYCMFVHYVTVVMLHVSVLSMCI
jgi:hypothetical protein